MEATVCVRVNAGSKSTSVHRKETLKTSRKKEGWIAKEHLPKETNCRIQAEMHSLSKTADEIRDGPVQMKM